LTIGPSAAASRIATNPAATISLAAGLGIIAVVAGIMLAYATDWPVGFYVSLIAFVEYALARFARRRTQAIA
jgi:zinc/manganese transport system permease protein